MNIAGTVYVAIDASEIADVLEATSAITEIAVYAGTNFTSNSVTVPGYMAISEGNVSKKAVYKWDDENHGAFNATSLAHGGTPSIAIKITTAAAATLTADTYAYSVDIMSWDHDASSQTNNAIYRVEAVETGDDTGIFEGTVAYSNLGVKGACAGVCTSGNDDQNAHSYISQNNQDVIIVMHSDSSGTDAPRVEYNDTDSAGSFTTRGTQLSTNNYTGIVEWDKDRYAGGDTAVVTITDPDLNQDNSLLETYTNSTGTRGTFGITCINSDGTSQSCVASAAIKIVEAGADSGTFVASFTVPSNYNDNKEAGSTIGDNMKASYYDSNDSGGGATTITSSAAISSSTGSISLDRTVYPTPWGGVSTSQLKCGDDSTTTNCSTIYGNVTVWITVHEPDNANDTLTCSAQSCVKINLDGTTIATAGNVAGSSGGTTAALEELGPLAETSRGSQDYEVSYTIPEFMDKAVVRIASGSVIQAEYVDPSDAGGLSLSVYDSASFDQRNASLSLDKDTYVLGADMVLTLNEPDLNLDSSTAESYHASLLEWDSAASSTRLLTNSEFGCTPSTIGETGADTGVFQFTCTFPNQVSSTQVKAGEAVTITYSDRNVAGENNTGDSQEDIEALASSSNFGAIVELDRAVYDWTDRVFITVTAPDHNKDSAAIESIGTSALPVQVSSRAGKLCSSTYTLQETGEDTGVFYGEVTLKGYASHTLISTSSNTCTGPTSGALLLAAGADGVTVSYEYSNSEVTIGSAITTWNIAEVSFGDSSVSSSGSTLIRLVDGDYDLNPDVINTKAVDLTSDSDSGGIQITLTETDEDTGIFEGTLFFTTSSASSGSILRVSEGDTVTMEFEDTTLPSPYGSSDTLTVASTTTVGTAFPPLERAPAANARVVDSFGNNVAEVSVDQQVQIAADVANGQDKDQSFAYLVQVQDSDGVTVSLSWITGSLTSGQSLSPAMSWIPTASGSYTATVFVWESVDNPTALSPTTSVDIDVV